MEANAPTNRPRPRANRGRLILLLSAAWLGVVGSANAAAAAQTSVPTASPEPEYQLTGATRTFSIDYVARISGVPAGTRELRIWLPVPHDSAVQSIRALSFSTPPRITRGTRYGNRFAYWVIPHPAPGTATEIHLRFICARRELRTNLQLLADAGDGLDPTVEYAVFRQPDRLGAIDDRITRLSAAITAGRPTTLAKARAIYDYVLAHMRYDKSQPGWGRGSTAYACDTGRGNCTDFHALFNSLCRAAGIASEFEIGLYLPYDRHSTEPVGGYHCWAYFRVPGRTWVPVDCSEASREPGRRAFFFGDHTNNRVTLSVGRDLTLEPEQAGPPLNYFVDPYAEADGKPVTATKTWSFRDLDESPEANPPTP